MTKLTKILAMLLMAAVCSFANWLGGTSEPENTKKIDGKVFYQITTPEELAWFAVQVNSGNATINAVLANDIVFGSSETTVCTKPWTPIGINSSSSFAGTLDGAGHTIYGLYVDLGFTYGGLFGYLSESGVVKNLRMGLGRIVGSIYERYDSYFGSIAAINYGTIQNSENNIFDFSSASKSTGTGHSYFGGIVGSNYGLILDCKNNGKINILHVHENSSTIYVGGIAGKNSGEILNCFNLNSVYVRDSVMSTSTYTKDESIVYSGGIVGYNSAGKVSNCKNHGSIETYFRVDILNKSSTTLEFRTKAYTGGIIGYNAGSVSTCYNGRDVDSHMSLRVESGRSDCSNTGGSGSEPKIEPSNYVGGISGYNSGTINNSYSDGYGAGGISGREIYYKYVDEDSYGRVAKCMEYGNRWYSRSDYGNMFEGYVVGRTIGIVRSSFGRNGEYWLNSVKGSGTSEYLKRDQFAWMLNTDNVTFENSGVWTRGTDGYPTFANADSLPIYRVVFNDEGIISNRYTNYLGYVSFPDNPEPPEGSIFTGWFNEDDVRVKPTTKFSADQIINAVYTDASDVYWNIKFYNADSTLLETQSVQHGGIVEYKGSTPNFPTTAQYTYTFAGWNVEPTNATENFDYYAVYDSTLNSYKVIFQDYDKKELSSSTYEYGVMPGYTENLTRASTVEWNYSHVGWTPAITAVTGESVYTAVYDSSKVEYTVTFMNGKEVLETLKVPYGSAAIPSVTPTREGYKFVSWSPQCGYIISDLIVKAMFEELIYHTITIKNENGEIIDNVDVEENGKLTLPSAAEKTGYKFEGWYDNKGNYLGQPGDVITISADISIEARYSVLSYTITFVDDNGAIIESGSVEFGTMPTAPADPSKASTAQYNYEFAGWSPAVAAVSGNATYTATYASKTRSYEVTFVDEDGSVIETVSVEYGKKPTAPAEPTKAATAQYSYEFAGWTPKIVAVSGNAIYTATYNAVVRNYTVTFADENGKALSSSSVAYGKIPTAPATEPTKVATAQYNYTFAGWTPELVKVTGDATYKATFTSTLRNYTITFVDEDGSEISKSAVAYGESPVAPAEPTKAATAQYSYEFAGWTPKLVKVTGDASYKASYNSILNAYKVTFLDYDGSTLKSQNVKYGAAATAPAVPERDGYKFTGWDKSFDEIVKDVDVTAQYEKLSSSSSVPKSSSSSVSSSSVKSSSSRKNESSSSVKPKSSSSAKPKSSSSEKNASSSSKDVDVLVDVLNVPLFVVSTVGRNIQIGAAKIGSAYIVTDLQGRTLKSGRVSASNFNISMSNAGTYLIRIGKQIRKVNLE